MEVQARDVGLGRLDCLGEDVRDLFLLRLRAGGEGGLRPETVDEVLEVGNLALLVLEGGELLGLACLAQAEKVVVVAVPAPEMLATQLKNAGAQGVEKRPVVGDHQQGARVARKVVLKPQQRLKIEVVGRLVQHQQVGRLHEESREVGAHDPAAGERPGGPMVIALAKTKPGEDLFGARLEGIVLDRKIVCGVGGSPGRGPALARSSRGGAHRELQDGLLTGRGAFLGQEADGGAALPGQSALFGRILAKDDSEQGCLACAICADESKAVAPQDGKRHLLEQGARSEMFGEAGDSKHGDREESRGNGPPSRLGCHQNQSGARRRTRWASAN